MQQHNEQKDIDITEFNRQCELLQSPFTNERNEASKYVKKCASDCQHIELWTRIICKCNNSQTAFTCLQILFEKIRYQCTDINIETAQKIREDLCKYVAENKEDDIPSYCFAYAAKCIAELYKNVIDLTIIQHLQQLTKSAKYTEKIFAIHIIHSIIKTLSSQCSVTPCHFSIDEDGKVKDDPTPQLLSTLFRMIKFTFTHMLRQSDALLNNGDKITWKLVKNIITKILQTINEISSFNLAANIKTNQLITVVKDVLVLHHRIYTTVNAKNDHENKFIQLLMKTLRRFILNCASIQCTKAGDSIVYTDFLTHFVPLLNKMLFPLIDPTDPSKYATVANSAIFEDLCKILHTLICNNLAKPELFDSLCVTPLKYIEFADCNCTNNNYCMLLKALLYVNKNDGQDKTRKMMSGLSHKQYPILITQVLDESIKTTDTLETIGGLGTFNSSDNWLYIKHKLSQLYNVLPDVKPGCIKSAEMRLNMSQVQENLSSLFTVIRFTFCSNDNLLAEILMNLQPWFNFQRACIRTSNPQLLLPACNEAVIVCLTQLFESLKVHNPDYYKYNELINNVIQSCQLNIYFVSPKGTKCVLPVQKSCKLLMVLAAHKQIKEIMNNANNFKQLISQFYTLKPKLVNRRCWKKISNLTTIICMVSSKWSIVGKQILKDLNEMAIKIKASTNTNEVAIKININELEKCVAQLHGLVQVSQTFALTYCDQVLDNVHKVYNFFLQSGHVQGQLYVMKTVKRYAKERQSKMLLDLLHHIVVGHCQKNEKYYFNDQILTETMTIVALLSSIDTNNDASLIFFTELKNNLSSKVIYWMHLLKLVKNKFLMRVEKETDKLVQLLTELMPIGLCHSNIEIQKVGLKIVEQIVLKYRAISHTPGNSIMFVIENCVGILFKIIIDSNSKDALFMNIVQTIGQCLLAMKPNTLKRCIYNILDTFKMDSKSVQRILFELFDVAKNSQLNHQHKDVGSVIVSLIRKITLFACH